MHLLDRPGRTAYKAVALLHCQRGTTGVLLTILICTVAAFVAGFIDAIAGGGGLITMPALLLTGVPPHMALGTGKLSAFLGSGVALLNFARSGLVLWRAAAVGVGFSLLGSYFGTLAALRMDSALLGKVLVALLPLGMAATLLPRRERRERHAVPEGARLWILTPLVCFLVGMYDGFFGPGTGSFLIIAFHYVLCMRLLAASATAKVLNLASNFGSLLTFLWSGKVWFALGLPMAAGSIAGNWLGSRMAIRAGGEAVRRFLGISLGLLFATLAYQYFIR